MERIVVIISGGMDSATLLAKLTAEGKEIHALSFDYGQRHKRELKSAKKICKHYKIAKHMIIKLPPIFEGSALTSNNIPVPEGHYEQENMKLTVVPNRNMIMLSIAIGYAEANKISKVYYGVHSGDHSIYWDCRPEFVEAINNVLKLNDMFRVEVKTPFLNIDKGDIASIGKSLKVPYKKTFTCYKGGKVPCGVCGACRERADAFKKAHLKPEKTQVSQQSVSS